MTYESYESKLLFGDVWWWYNSQNLKPPFKSLWESWVLPASLQLYSRRGSNGKLPKQEILWLHRGECAWDALAGLHLPGCGCSSYHCPADAWQLIVGSDWWIPILNINLIEIKYDLIVFDLVYDDFNLIDIISTFVQTLGLPHHTAIISPWQLIELVAPQSPEDCWAQIEFAVSWGISFALNALTLWSAATAYLNVIGIWDPSAATCQDTLSPLKPKSQVDIIWYSYHANYPMEVYV